MLALTFFRLQLFSLCPIHIAATPFLCGISWVETQAMVTTFVILVVLFILIIYIMREYFPRRNKWLTTLSHVGAIHESSVSPAEPFTAHGLAELLSHKIHTLHASTDLSTLYAAPELLIEILPKPASIISGLLQRLVAPQGIMIKANIHYSPYAGHLLHCTISELIRGSILESKSFTCLRPKLDSTNDVIRQAANWILFSGLWIPPIERGTKSPGSFNLAMDGIRLSMIGNHAEARTQLQRALDLDPRNGLANLRIGRYFLEEAPSKKPDDQEVALTKALLHFSLALKTPSCIFKAHWGSGDAFLMLNKYSHAIREYRKALRTLKVRQRKWYWHSQPFLESEQWRQQINVNIAATLQQSVLYQKPLPRRLKKSWINL
jgi:tetratricopeptide (TPR) repeat protein